jgi:two-component system nitrogen regulation sensor histidine kinase GlnL
MKSDGRIDPAPLPSARQLHAILDGLSIGVIAVDGSGLTQLQNAEASRILGASAAATLGRNLAEALGRQHPLVALLEEVHKTERAVSSPGVLLPARLGGDPLTADLTASPLVGPEGGEGAVATLLDRTIGRELEAFFDQRVRSELFANLAAGIAHEVRNPLAGIRGAAELLQKKLQEPALRRYPDLIRDEADRLRRLLDDLAELTRGADLRMRPLNLHRILDDLLELSRQSPEWEDVEIVREFDPSLPDVEADRDRMTQVFLNLLRNGVQAMRTGGRLVLRTRLETLYHLSKEGSQPVRLIRVEIEDSGGGISNEDLPHVFTPFFTGREGGSGLGLAVAQHWVVRHGGRIEIKSEVGRGTRVRVLLPARRLP